MAVQLIKKKIIKKFDLTDPNFRPPPQPEPEEVNGNVLVEEDEDVYGERKHFYQPENGNLQMTELMTGLINKLDNLKDKDPSEIGFRKFWKVLNKTKQTKFSDLIKERLYG